ncbi:hypothetical protein Dimus_018197 [Dionaea muscipula]
MEKIILHHLEWELTVPTCYVFLVRFIKASIPDNEAKMQMEKNLVVVVAREEVNSTKWYLEYLKPLVSKLDTPIDLRQHLALTKDQQQLAAVGWSLTIVNKKQLAC